MLKYVIPLPLAITAWRVTAQLENAFLIVKVRMTIDKGNLSRECGDHVKFDNSCAIHLILGSLRKRYADRAEESSSVGR